MVDKPQLDHPRVIPHQFLLLLQKCRAEVVQANQLDLINHLLELPVQQLFPLQMEQKLKTVVPVPQKRPQTCCVRSIRYFVQLQQSLPQ